MAGRKQLVTMLATALIALPALAESRSAFGPGEQSTYKINYLGVTGGTAEITVGAETEQAGRAVWPLVVVAKTDPALSFYPVKDRFVTYWDPKASVTVASELLADENHHRRRQRIRIDPCGTKATVFKQKEGEAEWQSTADVPPGALDIAAATFALRNQPLAVGREYEYPIFTGGHTFTLHAKVEGKETIRTPLGEREVFRLRLRTDFGGKFQSRSDLVAYVATDPSHLPLRVEASFVLGTLAAELTDYKPGTKVPDGIGGGG